MNVFSILMSAENLIDNKAGHVVGVSAASSTLWIDYIDLGIKVLSAIYISMLVISMTHKGISKIKRMHRVRRNGK